MKKIILLLGIVLTGCVANIKTYQHPEQSFGDYQTWCWLQGCEVTYQGPGYLYDQRAIDEISNVIAQQMYTKGYEQGDDNSDLTVNFFIVMQEDSTSVSDEYDDIITSSFYPQYEKFLKGSLVIDVIDRKKSELVWRSTAVRYMDLTPTYDEALINKVVTKAMEKLPAKGE